jgi:hypothetical protein
MTVAAESINIFTIEFPDPYAIDYYNDEFVTLGVRQPLLACSSRR